MHLKVGEAAVMTIKSDSESVTKAIQAHHASLVEFTSAPYSISTVSCGDSTNRQNSRSKWSSIVTCSSISSSGVVGAPS